MNSYVSNTYGPLWFQFKLISLPSKVCKFFGAAHQPAWERVWCLPRSARKGWKFSLWWGVPPSKIATLKSFTGSSPKSLQPFAVSQFLGGGMRPMMSWRKEPLCLGPSSDAFPRTPRILHRLYFIDCSLATKPLRSSRATAAEQKVRLQPQSFA